MSEPRSIPLSVPVLDGNEARYLAECIQSGWVSSAGPWVRRFEEEFARRTGMPDAVAVASGTAALHLSLIASGVEPNDEVLVPTLTFIAPINAVRYVSAHPVFLDCDDSLNLDPGSVLEFLEKECVFDGKETRRKSTGRRVRALLPVHVFGLPARTQELQGVAGRFGLTVIEDATEAVGSQYRFGSRWAEAGTQSDFGCFSFNGNKIITCGGGGMVVARNPALLKKVRYLSTQAKNDETRFVHDEIGYNYRLSSLHAAVGVAQLESLERKLQAKRRILSEYRQLLTSCGLDSHGQWIAEPAETRSNHWLIAWRLHEPRAEQVLASLQAQGIEARPIWRLNHEQAPYRSCDKGKIIRASHWHARTICLPSSPSLTRPDLERVAQALRFSLDATSG